MKKRFFLFPLFLLFAALAVYLLVQNQKNTEENGLWVSGTIELTEVDCAFRISGVIEELRFDEGDSVNQGDLIARLDDRELQDRRKRAEASLKMAESRVSQLLVAIEHQKRTSQGVVAQAKAQLAAAQAHLKELLKGARPQEIEESRAEVSRARSQLEKARLEWERARRLFASQTISKQQWDTAKAAFETARARYKQAREKYKLVREGPRKETIEAARSRVAEARAALEVAEAAGLKVEELKRELETARAQVEVARADLDLAETLISETRLYAPISGVVLSKNMERGEIALPGSSVLTLGDLKKVWLRAYINETDLGRVKVGQAAEVYTDTYPGKVYGGRISFISSKAEFTPKQIQTQEERVKLVYRIKIDIDNPRMELKSGMPADARIAMTKGGNQVSEGDE
ncbi:MAG: efflux RND transporter periplasmic adaptor subunit [Deltaproteobacteria bacterium]|nr:efflux RND transporter periplasmic adaptor subunit [Deltaproteobacteria bacterium]